MPDNTIVYTQTLESLSLGGGKIEEFPAAEIKYGFRLNRPGAWSFSLPLDHPKTTATRIRAGTHEIVVERNGNAVKAGPVLTVIEDHEANTLQVAGEGIMAYLRKMHITDTLTFEATVDDQFDIARALIDHHQNKSGGDFEIDTTSPTQSGRKRDHVYERETQKNVYDAIVELSQVDDGFDFNFNPITRAFDLFYPKRGGRLRSFVFDDRNIRRFVRQSDATSQASHLIGKFADDLIVSTQDSGAVDQFGLTQRVIVHKDITEQQEAIDHIQDALRAFRNVPNLISLTVDPVTPQLFTYRVGDEVKVNWPSKYNRVNEFQRLIGFDVVWTVDKEEAILYLEPL